MSEINLNYHKGQQTGPSDFPGTHSSMSQTGIHHRGVVKSFFTQEFNPETTEQFLPAVIRQAGRG